MKPEIVGAELRVRPAPKQIIFLMNQGADTEFRPYNQARGTMARFNSRLDRVRIAARCNADWEQMIGTDRVRFCGQCNLNVYNLSGMTRHEAETFVARNEGRLCVRFYRRADGSILTKNCPVGLLAIRRHLSYVARATATLVLGFFAGWGAYEAVANEGLEAQGRMGVMALPIGDLPPAEAGVPAQRRSTQNGLR